MCAALPATTGCELAGSQEDRIDKRFIRMNERIRAREIRVIGADGEQLGIMTPQDATRKAREQNFDLVEISPNAVPPVCRIMDYGKFLYEQEKKERAAKKKSISLRPRSDLEHSLCLCLSVSLGRICSFFPSALSVIFYILLSNLTQFFI